MTELTPGSLFAERYRVDRLLGRGTTGWVYLVEDTIRREPAVIRVIYEDLVVDAGGWDHLVAILRRITAVNHPACMRFHDFNRWEQWIYLVGEYVRGKPLLDTIENLDAELDPTTLSEWVEQSVEGLLAISPPLGHGGLKPSNLLVTAQGQLKILDGGLATIVSPEKRKATAMALGEVGYLAPEHFADEKPLGFLADQYSLGQIWLSVGLSLAERKSVEPEMARLQRQLLGFAKRMIVRDPADRFATPEALEVASRNLRTGGRAEMASTGFDFAAGYRTVRGRLVLLSLCLLLVFGLGWFFWGRDAGANRDWTPELVELQTRWQAHHRDRMAFLSTLPPESMGVDAFWAALDPATETDWLTRLTTMKLRQGSWGVGTQIAKYQELESKLIAFQETRMQVIRCRDNLRALEGLRDQLVAMESDAKDRLIDPAPNGARAIEEVFDRIKRRSFLQALDAGEASRRQIETYLRGPVARAATEARDGQARWRASLAEKNLPLLEPNGNPSELITTATQQEAAGQFSSALGNLLKAATYYREWNSEWNEVSAASADHWENSLGLRFVRFGVGRVSVWETRVIDFAVYVFETGADARYLWREAAEDLRSGPLHPVVSISDLDARRFCQWLTVRDRERGLIDDGWEYRLPTDREWSVLAGLTDEGGESPFERHLEMRDHWPWGAVSVPKAIRGNYFTPPNGDPSNNYRECDPYYTTAPVGRFSPNRLGLYDIGGNVWEFTANRMLVSDESIPNTNRAVRGGSWRTVSLEAMRTGFRLPRRYDRPDIGFRCVLAPIDAGLLSPNAKLQIAD